MPYFFFRFFFQLERIQKNDDNQHTHTEESWGKKHSYTSRIIFIIDKKKEENIYIYKNGMQNLWRYV